MITAKIPGVNIPCRKRQNRSCPKLVAVAPSSVGTASRNAAGTITRLRPKRSATTPAKGAAKATASVEAVTTRLMAAAETRNSRASKGNSGCGAKSVTKAQNPANTTAAVRAVECGVACEGIPSIMPGAGPPLCVSTVVQARACATMALRHAGTPGGAAQVYLSRTPAGDGGQYCAAGRVRNQGQRFAADHPSRLEHPGARRPFAALRRGRPSQSGESVHIARRNPVVYQAAQEIQCLQRLR